MPRQNRHGLQTAEIEPRPVLDLMAFVAPDSRRQIASRVLFKTTTLAFALFDPSLAYGLSFSCRGTSRVSHLSFNQKSNRYVYFTSKARLSVVRSWL